MVIEDRNHHDDHQVTTIIILNLSTSVIAIQDRAGFKRNLNSNLPLGQVALKFCCPLQVLVCSFMDLVGRWLADPLSIGQVRMKSYLPRKRIYLFWTIGRDFFQAVQRLAYFWTSPLYDFITNSLF